jgi:peptidoglycan pentaglycine glycine transferase (the first glycine)
LYRPLISLKLIIISAFNYLIYKNQVIDAHNNGYKIFDAFGTIGDPKSDKSLVGLHEFKKKFGGEYIEFIGEFDYIQKKLIYLLFTKLVPYYRKLVNKRLKKTTNN